MARPFAGKGLAIGFDSDDREYGPKFAFTNGEIKKVIYDVAGDGYVDLERRMAAVLARD